MTKLKPGVEFVDAQQMGKEHPDTFYTLTSDELSKISPGDHVKVCLENHKQDGERFWVLVSSVVGESIEGTVVNRLLGANLFGVDYNDTVRFQKRHIYDRIPLGGFTGNFGADVYTLPTQHKDWRKS